MGFARQSKHTRVDKDFLTKLRKIYPVATSDRDATRRLNDVLDEMLYGKKKNDKKKIRK